ncbi:MAG: competence/damage-inducible protein A [Magnetococcales bacterium]|nr:competence/damage-inducible protein A [Magnetococcales bacterium]
MPAQHTTVGIIIVGDELLGGKRQDRHMPHVIDRLHPLGMRVAWVYMIGDERQALARFLRRSFTNKETVFCFGGIGATPDDITRQAAADALNVSLIRHPEAVREIEKQFGETAYPHRILMAELPPQAGTIPNEYNGIPAFFVDHHYFLPGFPELAWPMLEWVIEHRLPQCNSRESDTSLIVSDIGESVLLPILETMTERYPEVIFSSLPQLQPLRIELGLRSRNPEALSRAEQDLHDTLHQEGITIFVQNT